RTVEQTQGEAGRRRPEGEARPDRAAPEEPDRTAGASAEGPLRAENAAGQDAGGAEGLRPPHGRVGPAGPGERQVRAGGMVMGTPELVPLRCPTCATEFDVGNVDPG